MAMVKTMAMAMANGAKWNHNDEMKIETLYFV